MIKMKIIHPHKDETYQIGFDDSCLVVSSGSEEGSPKSWLSYSMCSWIKEHLDEIFKSGAKAPIQEVKK